MADEYKPTVPRGDWSRAGRSLGDVNAMVTLTNAVTAGLSGVYATTRSIVVTALVTALVVVLVLGRTAGRKWPRKFDQDAGLCPNHPAARCTP